MFLIERLIGVGSYVGCLIVAVCLLYCYQVDCRKIFRGYTAALAVMAFCFTPNPTADLTRIYSMMEKYAEYGVSEFVEKYVLSSSTPAANLIYYGIGRTGVLSLLPMLSAVVTYSCCFYILYHAAEKFQVSRKNLAIALLFYMSIGNYIFVVSNIRTMMAISLLTLCFFRESVERKWNPLHLLLYAAAALIHNLAAVLLVLRVAVPLFDRRLDLWKRLLIVLAGLAAGFGVILVKIEWVNEILSKALHYITDEPYFHRWEYRIAILVGCAAIWLLWELRKTHPKYRETLTGIKTYLILCLVVAVWMCQVYSIFHRMLTYVAPILILPLILVVLRRTSGEEADYQRVLRNRKILTAVSLVLLALSCTKGSMTWFKFFALS